MRVRLETSNRGEYGTHTVTTLMKISSTKGSIATGGFGDLNGTCPINDESVSLRAANGEWYKRPKRRSFENWVATANFDILAPIAHLSFSPGRPLHMVPVTPKAAIAAPGPGFLRPKLGPTNAAVSAGLMSPAYRQLDAADLSEIKTGIICSDKGECYQDGKPTPIRLRVI